MVIVSPLGRDGKGNRSVLDGLFYARGVNYSLE